MKTLHLYNAQQANASLRALWIELKPWLIAGHKYVLTVKPETRSTAANALLHAALTDVAEQAEWAGRKWDVEVWKRLMTASWCRAHGEPVTILPALDGHGVDVVFRRTSTLTKAECSDLVEYIHAWGIENNVTFKTPENHQ